MLRSKATAALMKFKEIDKKYKAKSTEDLKIESSLSDVSRIDSADEISKYLASSGDKSDAIVANMRLKLDIRMPDAHMEREILHGNESELITISDKSKKLSPKSEGIISPEIIDGEVVSREQNFDHAIEEENVFETLEIISMKDPSLTINEEKRIANTETSISEDVPEAVLSSDTVSNHLETNGNREISIKSTESIIEADERVQSDLADDPSTLVASGTYSDDFVKTFSSENEKESNTGSGKLVTMVKTEALESESQSLEIKHVTSTSSGYNQRWQSFELNKNIESNSKDIEESIVAEVIHSDANFKANPANELKRNNHEDVENLPRQKSSMSSSARNSKERRRSGRPRTSSSSRSSESRELPSSFKQKDPKAIRASGTSSSAQSRGQGGKNSSETNRSTSEKDLRNFQRVFFIDAQEKEREAIVHGVSRSSKEQVIGVTRKEKMSSEPNKLKHTRVKNPKNEDTAPPKDSEENKTNKHTSVPSRMIEPVQKYPKFWKDDTSYRSAQYVKKHWSISREQNSNRRSNKRRTEDSPGSQHRAKGEGGGGGLRRCKKQSKEEPGVGYKGRDVDRLRQQVKELRLQHERDELRSWVRGYVQQMMIKQLRLSAGGFESRKSIGQIDYSATGSGQAGSLWSLFKPLDLPNVAAFKRPEFDEDQDAASTDSNNKKQYLHLRMIRERIFGIRDWLKQQFVLYKDYSSLVATVNAKYIPVTLKDTKKMIHDMQNFRNGRERRHYER